MKRPPDFRERLSKVRLFATDVDGVLTDGTLYYGEHGETLKAFHVRDGLGIRLLQTAGLDFAVITARSSPALERRLTELRVGHQRLGREDKWSALEEVMARVGVTAEAVAFAGDDLLDLPVLRRVGVAIAVADAHPRVVSEAYWVTRFPGGGGAVREIIDAILETRGELAGAIAALLDPQQ